MSVRLVTSGSGDNTGQEFAEIFKLLENQLMSCEIPERLSVIIEKIKDYSRQENFTPIQRDSLSKLRQRAYDKKRRVKPTSSPSPLPLFEPAERKIIERPEDLFAKKIRTEPTEKSKYRREEKRMKMAPVMKVEEIG